MKKLKELKSIKQGYYNLHKAWDNNLMITNNELGLRELIKTIETSVKYNHSILEAYNHLKPRIDHIATEVRYSIGRDGEKYFDQYNPTLNRYTGWKHDLTYYILENELDYIISIIKEEGR